MEEGRGVKKRVAKAQLPQVKMIIVKLMEEEKDVNRKDVKAHLKVNLIIA